MTLIRTGALAAATAALAIVCAEAAAPTGDYTQAQAQAGKQVYASTCAACHGSNLKGQSGPALAGKAFASNLEYSKMTATQLFDFTKRHMPKNAPGSLSDDQYRQVFAYILSQNGYPAGQQQLSASTIGNVNLLPYPGQGSSGSGSGQQ